MTLARFRSFFFFTLTADLVQQIQCFYSRGVMAENLEDLTFAAPSTASCGYRIGHCMLQKCRRYRIIKAAVLKMFSDVSVLNHLALKLNKGIKGISHPYLSHVCEGQ